MRGIRPSVTRHESELAAQVLAKYPLPEGVTGFSIDPDEDYDGDPVLFIWLNLEDADRRDKAFMESLRAFMDPAGRELLEALEEYWPHFRLRAA